MEIVSRKMLADQLERKFSKWDLRRGVGACYVIRTASYDRDDNGLVPGVSEIKVNYRTMAQSFHWESSIKDSMKIWKGIQRYGVVTRLSALHSVKDPGKARRYLKHRYGYTNAKLKRMPISVMKKLATHGTFSSSLQTAIAVFPEHKIAVVHSSCEGPDWFNILALQQWLNSES